MTDQNRIAIPRGLLFIYMALLQLLCLSSAARLNCSSPDPESMFTALESVFKRSLLRPVRSFAIPTNVSISFTLVGVLDVDEKSQTLSTFIWQILEWDIMDLSWDPEQCGAQRVSIPRDKLWVPDIHISEFMDEDRSPHTPYVYLDNTGHVYDDRPRRVVSSCKLLIYAFPFDIQNCSLTFGSYLHFATDVSAILGATAEEVLKESKQVIQTSGEWELVDIRATKSSLELVDGSYSEVTFFIVLRRRPTIYLVNLIIPSTFLVTVDLFSFLLPPQSVDRSSFKMTLILGYTVFLLIMNDLLPVTGETTPIINVFFSISLALMVASLLETVFITNIQCSSTHYPAVPRCVSVLVLQYLARVVCLPPRPSSRVTVILNSEAQVNGMEVEPHLRATQLHINEDPNKTSSCKPPTPVEPALKELRKLSSDLQAIRLQMDKHFRGSKSAEEWIQIGNVIDRLLFSLYILFISVSFITIITVWSTHYSV